MQRAFRLPTYLTFTLVCLSTAAWGSTVNIGYASWDATFPGNSGSFDITDLTGPNALPSDFPVTTAVSLSDLSLSVVFSNGTSETFGSSYFTLSAVDGLSLGGDPIPIGGTNPQPVEATIKGTFDPLTITLDGGGTENIEGAFTATITPSSGRILSDGDLALITATTASSKVPEPGSWVLLTIGLGGLALGRLRSVSKLSPKTASMASRLLPAAIAILMSFTLFASGARAITLTSATTPDNGTAGINDVSVTGSGFPTGTITPKNIVVQFAATCGGTEIAATTAISLRTIVLSTKRVTFLIPGNLAAGIYNVSIRDTTTGDATFTSSNCSRVNVTHTNPTLSACIPTSSLGVLAPSKKGNVTAYVPKGCWGCSSTDIFVRNIEGAVTPGATIATPNITNSCSSNPATGETVCVANNTDVYLISGTKLNKILSSSSDTTASFSGGTCQNCGVAINALSNKAVIAGGFSGGATNDGVQLLDLNTNIFGSPFPMNNQVSEDILVDPTRNLILTPGEGGNYTILQIQSDGSTLKEFSGPSTGLQNDSAGEDCSTGIALTPGEFTNTVFVEDLTRTVFSGSSYIAPGNSFTFTTNYSFSAGLNGVTVAPGSAHLAVATGEFGGNTLAVLQLPSTSGSGTPTIPDYAVAAIPDSPECGGFSAGFDPHTVTAYTSANDGKAYALLAGYSGFRVPVCLVRIDLAALLAAPRGGLGLQAHDVSPSNFPTAAATFYSLP